MSPVSGAAAATMPAVPDPDAVRSQRPRIVVDPGVLSEGASHTAAQPAEHRGLPRDGVRMLVAHGADRPRSSHARFRDLPQHLRAGDLLVVNTSATRPGQIDAVRATGGHVVVHVAQLLDDSREAVLELRQAPDAGRAILDARPGELFDLAGGPRARLLRPYPDGPPSSPSGQGNRLWRASVDRPLEAHLARHGRPIAYGYLDAPYPLSDYQSVFASRPGSAEMASAGRPFTPELIARLVGNGVHLVTVTLHTGVSSQEAGERVGPEWFEVPASTAAAVNAARDQGGRVIAVGTTVTRALESAVSQNRVIPQSGWTDHLVTPKTPPRVVDGLITGWHDPQASHLLLVEAVAGRALGQHAYDEAFAAGYLWHEFGDTALLLPR